MKNCLYILFFFFLNSSPVLCQTKQHLLADVFEILMERIRKDFAQNPSIEQDLSHYNEANGAFNDVDYSSIQRTMWPSLTHLQRVRNFVFAYTNHQNPYYKDPILYQKILKSLEFWHERNPWCHNWWYNQIAEPQCLGVLLIQMRQGAMQLPKELEAKLLKRMKTDGGHPAKWTGANRTDIALHWIYRACLSKDEVDLKIALDNAYSSLEYTTKEGFQHDNSYFQHGAQLYIGGYGDEIIKGVTQIAIYTQGTPYAVPAEKLAVLSKFMRETYYRTIRGKFMLFDVLGRGVSRLGNTRRAETTFAERMIELDPEHAEEYQVIIERLRGKQPAGYAITPQHTHYFRGDYTLHTRPEYTFDVRLASNRTVRCEYGNGENLKTYFLSDGCTNIVVDGNEYDQIFPVWNWARIPGITAPQMDSIPLAKRSWNQKGSSTFAGGVSDSIYGVTTYSYIDNYAQINTKAKKSWFFFDDEIVCLGAGISSTSPYEIFTTVNQCLLNQKEIIVSDRKGIRKMQPHCSDVISADWVLHNNVGYVFPEQVPVFVSNQTQIGNWLDINRTGPKDEISKEVFTIGLSQGVAPVNAHYAYIVVPGKQTVKEFERYIKQNKIEIIVNTDEQQIVRDPKAKVWQLVFYRAGTFRHKELTIHVNCPCALILKEEKQKMHLHLADPQQAKMMIEVDICMPFKSSKNQHFRFDFTQSGIYAGATQYRQWRWKK